MYTGLHEYGAGPKVFILFWCWVSTLLASIITGEVSKYIRKKRNNLDMVTSPSSAESVKEVVGVKTLSPPKAKVHINYTISYEIPLPGTVSLKKEKGHKSSPEDEKPKDFVKSDDGTRVEDT